MSFFIEFDFLTFEPSTNIVYVISGVFIEIIFNLKISNNSFNCYGDILRLIVVFLYIS